MQAGLQALQGLYVRVCIVLAACVHMSHHTDSAFDEKM